MRLELKRTVRSGFLILFLLLNLLNVILGYVLLVTIDHIQHITFQDLFASVYTVYTQFGTLLFSVLIIMPFYMDYKEKTILFYRTMGSTALSYYLQKTAVLVLVTLLGSALASLLICMPYGKMAMAPVVFMKIESVMLYYSFLISVFGFVFGNFLLAFFVSFFLWIVGIFVSASSPVLACFAYYDAASADYGRFGALLRSQAAIGEWLPVTAENYLFDLALLGCCLIVIFLCRKRWMKNGT